MRPTKQSPGSLPKAPEYNELPIAKPRAARGSPQSTELRVRLEVVTPIFGGSHQTREIDDVDVIRGPSVRGHLRFWWRALYATQCSSAAELYQCESKLWGRAATDHEGGRSAVEIRVDVEGKAGAIDASDVNPQQTPGAYALWPARAEKKRGQVGKRAARRRKPGTKIQLALKVPVTAESEVKNALRAWILFGGYGGRTRRGLGSLGVLDDARTWLPSAATREALANLFGFDIFAIPMKAQGDVPWLGGAAMHVGEVERDAQKAWTRALDWLNVFRQGTKHQQGGRAREPSSDPKRPSISNWPEADKVRHHSTPRQGLRWAHTPSHNDTAAWPRAGFGLPIVGQFQSKSREQHPTRKKRNGRPDEKYWNELPAAHPNYGAEPEGFALCWRVGNIEHERLASPLIVKALPVAEGTFAPCALWLNRAHPVNAEVILCNANDSQAPFDRLVAEGDAAHFSALANKTSLRQAFLDWLHANYQTTAVAP